MKRLLSLCMAVLLIALTPCACAAADDTIAMFDTAYRQTHGMETVEDGLYIKSICYANGAFYVYMTDRRVYRAEAGGAPEVYCELPKKPADDAQAEDVRQVGYMATDGETLYGFSSRTGSLCTIDAEGAHWTDVTLDLSALVNDDGSNNIIPNLWVDGGRLCALVYDTSSMDAPYSLWTYDLTTGAATPYPIEDLAGACPGAPGEILCMTGYLSGAYTISALSLSDGSEQSVVSCGSIQSVTGAMGGMAYDAASKTLYMASGNRIWKSVDSAAFESVAVVDTRAVMTDTQAWALPDGRYAALLDGLTICAESNVETIELTVTGYVQGKPMELFSKRRPEAVVQFKESGDTQQLLDMLSTRDDSIDIFMAHADYLFSEMKRKGLAAPLDFSEALVQDAARMDETIRAAVSDADGHIVAYPKMLLLRWYGVNLGYWSLFWPDRDYPETFEEVFEAWADFEENIAEDYPGVGFIDWPFDYGEWVADVITLYVLQHDVQMPELTAEPLVKTLKALERVAQIRQVHGRTIDGGYDPQIESTEIEGCGMVFWPNYRDAMAAERPSYADMLYGVEVDRMTGLPLRFEKGESGSTDARLDVYVVNPYSKNIDAAIDFIECLAEGSADTALYYACHPDCVEPVENADYEGQRERMTARLEEAQIALEDARANDEDTTALEAQIAYYKEWLSRDDLRYTLSAGTIAAYRAQVAEHPLNLHVDSPYVSLSTLASDFIEASCQQYAAGQLTMEAMLRQIMEKVEMIRAESE